MPNVLGDQITQGVYIIGHRDTLAELSDLKLLSASRCFVCRELR